MAITLDQTIAQKQHSWLSRLVNTQTFWVLCAVLLACLYLSFATDSFATTAGLAGWLLVHPGFEHWSYGKDATQSPTRDEVLDDFTLYWLTNSAASSARLYWENRGRSLTSASAQKTSEILLPVAVTVFPDEVYQPPKTWVERAFSNLIYFHEADRGGHFAAWDYPELFAAELRAAFEPLRSAT